MPGEGIPLAERDQLLQHLDVVAAGAGFEHDVLHLVAEILALGLEPLVALDELAQLDRGGAVDAVGHGLVGGGVLHARLDGLVLEKQGVGHA